MAEKVVLEGIPAAPDPHHDVFPLQQLQVKMGRKRLPQYTLCEIYNWEIFCSYCILKRLFWIFNLLLLYYFSLSWFGFFWLLHDILPTDAPGWHPTERGSQYKASTCSFHHIFASRPLGERESILTAPYCMRPVVWRNWRFSQRSSTTEFVYVYCTTTDLSPSLRLNQ